MLSLNIVILSPKSNIDKKSKLRPPLVYADGNSAQQVLLHAMNMQTGQRCLFWISMHFENKAARVYRCRKIGEHLPPDPSDCWCKHRRRKQIGPLEYKFNLKYVLFNIQPCVCVTVGVAWPGRDDVTRFHQSQAARRRARRSHWLLGLPCGAAPPALAASLALFSPAPPHTPFTTTPRPSVFPFHPGQWRFLARYWIKLIIWFRRNQTVGSSRANPSLLLKNPGRY